MAVPKKKVSKSRRNMRRAHHKLNMKTSGFCSNCNGHKKSHNICDNCGYYNGKLIKEPKKINTNK